MEEVPQDMGQPQVQFYLERVSYLGIETFFWSVSSEDLGPIHYEAIADINIFHTKRNKLFFAETSTYLTENFTS